MITIITHHVKSQLLFQKTEFVMLHNGMQSTLSSRIFVDVELMPSGYMQHSVSEVLQLMMNEKSGKKCKCMRISSSDHFQQLCPSSKIIHCESLVTTKQTPREFYMVRIIILQPVSSAPPASSLNF